MEFTGERAILGGMPGRMRIAQEHLTRYTFALGILEGNNCKTVLDAACGSGYGTHLLGQAGFEPTGVDIDEKTVTLARQIFGMVESYSEDKGYGVERLPFVVSSLDAPEEEYLDKKYDAIVSFETIEHLENPDKFLEWVKTKTDLLIFSLPINQPSEFHKHVYNEQQAIDLIKGHFKDAHFYAQAFMNIYEVRHGGSGSEYIIGYAKP